MAKAGTQKKTNVADRDFSLSASIGERVGVRCRIQTAHATGNGNGAKVDIWWRSARMNPCISNPKLNGWGGDHLREDAPWKFGVRPAGNANYAWMQNIIHHLAPTGIACLVLANSSMSNNQSVQGEIRNAIIEADLVDCMVALPGQLLYSTRISMCFCE